MIETSNDLIPNQMEDLYLCHPGHPVTQLLVLEREVEAEGLQGKGKEGQGEGLVKVQVLGCPHLWGPQVVRPVGLGAGCHQLDQTPGTLVPSCTIRSCI